MVPYIYTITQGRLRLFLGQSCNIYRYNIMFHPTPTQDPQPIVIRYFLVIPDTKVTNLNAKSQNNYFGTILLFVPVKQFHIHGCQEQLFQRV